MKGDRVLIAAACAALALAACGREELARPARDHAGEEVAVPAPAERTAPRRSAESSTQAGAGDAAVRRIGGRPMWADSRRYTAVENAAYQFEQHAEELGASDLDDFLRKAHRFVNDPPAGAKTLVRANGDRLYYDPESGLFGVVRQDGAPRTVFKPRDGEAYWTQQARENQTGRAASGSRADGAGG